DGTSVGRAKHRSAVGVSVAPRASLVGVLMIDAQSRPGREMNTNRPMTQGTSNRLGSDPAREPIMGPAAKESADFLFDLLVEVVPRHQPEIEPVLCGIAGCSEFNAVLTSRALQAQGIWFQLPWACRAREVSTALNSEHPAMPHSTGSISGWWRGTTSTSRSNKKSADSLAAGPMIGSRAGSEPSLLLVP